MPHIRHRYARPLLDKYLRFSPIVGLIGHRQVGKTTLASDICSAYFSLDDEESIAYLVNSAAEFVREIHSGTGTVAIDEAQLMPKLFPALKEWVRKHKRPGQFLLSGSVRFTSQKSIRESLTGRVVNLELLPFSISELEGESQSEIPFQLHMINDLSERDSAPEFSDSTYKARTRLIESFAELGGLPGVCFVRDKQLRSARLRTQLETILDRDLRLLNPTKISLNELKQLLRSLSATQGQPVRVAALQRQIGIGARATQNILNTLESLFLIRSIPIEGDYRGSIFFFEDTAESYFLNPKKMHDQGLREHLCFLMLRSSLAYRAEMDPQYFQFKTRGGSTVPIAVRMGEKVSGWIPIHGDKPDRREQAAGKAFLAAYAQSKVFFVNFESQGRRVLDQRRMILSCAEMTA